MTTCVEIVDDHFLFADALGSVIRTLPDYQVVGIAQSGAQAIADTLTISANTVRTHLQNIFSKLGAHSKLEAVATATARGLLAR